MLPTEAGGSSGGDRRKRSSCRIEDQQLEASMPFGVQKCGNGQVSSSQLFSFVPNSMSVPATSFQPGFSHFEPPTNHFQCQFSPYALPLSGIQRSPMLDDNAPSASYALQELCMNNGFDQHFNSSGTSNSVTPPSFQQDNSFMNLRSEYNSSVFMAPSSHLKAATLPEFTFSVNFALSRPDGASEFLQSINLESSQTLGCRKEFGDSEVSHQIFSQSQNFFNPRLSHEERVTVMRKELTKSDVASIGRIVIPKKDAEANFPPLFEREGIVLRMEDVATPFTWEFKYRFWPNNKSRMYILENAGEFIKTHGLQAGDFLSIHKNPVSATYEVMVEIPHHINITSTGQTAGLRGWTIVCLHHLRVQYKKSAAEFVEGKKKTQPPEKDVCLKS